MSKAEILGGVLSWVLAVLLALVFAYVGGAKLASNPGMVREFAQIGFGQWLRYLTGFLEVSGALGVLVPKFRFWAALQIALVMAGATVTNLFILRISVLAGLTAVLLVLRSRWHGWGGLNQTESPSAKGRQYCNYAGYQVRELIAKHQH